MCSSSAPAIPPARSWPRLQSTIPQSAGASSRATARVDIRKAPHPLALEILRQNHIPTDGLRSKSRSEFAGAGAPQLDFVITVCDQAAAEPCPVWPGQPMTAHWGVPDPASVEGTEEETRRAFPRHVPGSPSPHRTIRVPPVRQAPRGWRCRNGWIRSERTRRMMNKSAMLFSEHE